MVVYLYIYRVRFKYVWHIFEKKNKEICIFMIFVEVRANEPLSYRFNFRCGFFLKKKKQHI